MVDDARLDCRELTYEIIVHGEVNALMFAQRAVVGCTLYTSPFMSCSRCAALIIQAGIREARRPPQRCTTLGAVVRVITTALSRSLRGGGVAMMTCDPSVVDIMMTEYSPQVKYRLCVGYHIPKGLYSMRKFGLVSPRVAGEVHPQDTLMRACEHTYHGIQTSGEITIPIFGYDLGEPCEYDDDGVPIGTWPPIGEAKITYTEKFLMKHSTLPPGYEHLLPMRWLKP